MFVVLVASIRALKVHVGLFKMTVGRPLDKKIECENLRAVELGSSNLKKQIENSIIYGIPCVVAINNLKRLPIKKPLSSKK